MNARSKFTFRMAREERGVALPVALSILFLVAGLTSIAAKAGIVSDHFSSSDRNAKRARPGRERRASRRPSTS